MGILPPRPLRLLPSFVRRCLLLSTLLLLPAAAAFVGAVYYVLTTTASIHHDQALWHSGVPVDDADVSGDDDNTDGIFHTYRLTVTYDDQDDNPHVGTLRFDSIVHSIDRSTRPEVRYNPENPDDFAL